MSKQIVLTIGDSHLADVNYGRHKDYASDCEIMMDRVVSAVEGYVDKIGGKMHRIVILGDFADTRFSHLEFRLCVEKYLERLKACAEKLYCLKGNHDEASGLMTELDYYVGRGVIDAHPEEETIGGKVVRYVDFIRDPEECAQAHEGDGVEVIFTHNALAAGENTLFSSVDVSKLDAPKLRVGVMGHIHGEMYFKAHNRHGQDVSILDGGASCVRSAARKDAEGFNLLALHFDGETGKIGSKKIPVKYVEDAFMDVDASDEGVKWSVDSSQAVIDFSVSGAGSMDIDDLAKQLGKTASPEVVSAVKMLFEKYGKVSMTDDTVAVETEVEDDGLLDDITGMFKGVSVSAAGGSEDKAAEPEAVVESDSDDDGSLDVDALCDGGEDEASADGETDELDDLLNTLAEDGDEVSLDELISKEDAEALKSGAVASIDLGDGTKIAYKDGGFVFAD